MVYQATVGGESFRFPSLADLMAKANEEKAGDQLAGVAAISHRQRIAAKRALADCSLQDFLSNPLIDPELDEVSRRLLEDYDPIIFEEFQSWTVGELRDQLLAASPDDLSRWGWGLLPEMAAAVAKLLTNQQLIVLASRIHRISRMRNTQGLPGTLGIRIQPNHPSDDLRGILASTIEGLLFGCGDAVIGVNPATDSVAQVSAILRMLDQLIQRAEIPTQHCCLAHITTQLQALETGCPIDLLFQSIAGSQKANDSFGVTLQLLHEGRQQVIESHRSRDRRLEGAQVMYFETGQGSALSANAHHGIDQLTMEARAYGVARLFDPFLVNSVVGFIGPEYLFDERQIVRAGLEDHFLGKLLGLPMGVDVCYTNHCDADQNSADNLMVLLAAAGCNYFMGVPGTDDIMLNYQSTSYHDAVAVRKLFQRQPAPEFQKWLEERQIDASGGWETIEKLRQIERLIACCPMIHSNT
jgi:ethanolamine ammonia-lyase large subunit